MQNIVMQVQTKHTKLNEPKHSPLFSSSILIENVFNTHRLQTLQMLTSQAAISLENARMILELNRVTSELRSQCEKLEALDSLKDRFLATTSHELRTPLNAVIAGLYLIPTTDFFFFMIQISFFRIGSRVATDYRYTDKGFFFVFSVANDLNIFLNDPFFFFRNWFKSLIIRLNHYFY